MISEQKCNARNYRYGMHASDFAWVQPPLWVEMLIASVDLLLVAILVNFSKHKHSTKKWIAFFALVTSLIAQAIIGDLGRLIKFMKNPGGTEANVLNLAMPLTRAFLTACTITEEFLTVRYAHMLYGQDDSNGSKHSRKREQIVAFVMLVILVALFVTGLTLTSCKTARFYMTSSNMGRGDADNQETKPAATDTALTVCAVGLLLTTLILDIYQEVYRIRHNKWKFGPTKTTWASLRVTSYATAGWMLLVLWICVKGLPDYYSAIYVGAVTTLALPATGVMTELYKIGKYGMSLDSFLE